MRAFAAAVALLVPVLSASACSVLVAADPCAAPPLVTTSGDPSYDEVALHRWEPDGGSVPLDSGPTGRGAVFSPDGSTVAFTSPEGGYSDTFGYAKSRVALLSIETGGVTPVSSDIPDSTVGHLHWSSDGSEIAFVRWLADTREIVALRIEDGAERRLLVLNIGQSGFFAWSSDRRQLLVPTWLDMLVPPTSSASSPKVELRRYSVDTGDYMVVENPHTIILDIELSPDDRFVAMHADIPGTTRWRLFVLDLESGISTPVDRRRGGPQSMAWSGAYLLYVYDVWAPDDARYLMRWDSRTHDRVHMDRPGIDSVVGHSGSISAPRCGSWGR
jgi:dipeptidyl aminopeptidase/acylaminoacyl peptidase